MQQALLIDEIIRLILQFSAEERPSTLNALTRTCRAWQSPALDYLWARLSSIAPLLELIPGVELADGTYVLKTKDSSPDLTRLHLHARRVKHISHRCRVKVDPAIVSILDPLECLPPSHPIILLPALCSAQLSSSNFDRIQACLSLSATLSKLDLDLGFKTKASNEQLNRFLQEVAKTSRGLHHLNIRGSLPVPLVDLVSSMDTLQTLSLRLGSSLTVEALLAVASFPNLSKLEIHAGHIDADELSSAITLRGTTIFPSLTRLHIRAHMPLLAHLLESIPIDVLHTLRIEAEEVAGVPATWGPVFKAITTKAANSLMNLTIEHHIEVDEMELESSSSDNTPSPSPGQPRNDTPIPFSDLRILTSLHNLEKFVLDTTLPPVMCDEELETLAKGWPKLQHFDLSSSSPRPSLTTRTLGMFAARTPYLKNLIMSTDLNGIDTTTIPTDAPSSNSLTRLTLSYPPPSDPTPAAQYLHRLFPLLLEVDGLAEHEDEWDAIQNTLQKMTSAA